jgi:hypothetical protein
MIRALGCDPGSQFGLFMVEIEETLSLTTARYVASETIARRTGKQIENEIAADLDMAERAFVFCHEKRPSVIVLEEAAEAKGIRYRGYVKQKTETAFRSGAYYALALSAFGRYQRFIRFERARWLQDVPLDEEEPTPVSIFAYPAVNSKGRGNGWMGHSSRQTTVERLLILLKAVNAPAKNLEIVGRVMPPKKPGGPSAVVNEFRRHHEADALGVLNYHFDQARLMRQGKDALARARERFAGPSAVPRPSAGADDAIGSGAAARFRAEQGFEA